jgi:hypothetical protein
MQTRIANTKPSDQRLAEETVKLKQQVNTLGIGNEPEKLLRNARQAETASHIYQWLGSPGLRKPS